MSKVRIGITSGMSGHFAVMYDGDGPIQTGIGRYSTPEQAHDEAMEWAESEGLPFDSFEPTPQLRFPLPARLRAMSGGAK